MKRLVILCLGLSLWGAPAAAQETAPPAEGGSVQRILNQMADVLQGRLEPLPLEQAVPYLLVALFFVFFGIKVYAVTVKLPFVLFMGTVFGHVAGWVAQALGAEPLLWTIVVGIVGGLIAIPLERIVRTFIGAVAGMAVGALLGNMVDVPWQSIVTVAGLGFLGGGIAMYFFERAILITAFSIWGSFLALHSVASIYQEGRPELIIGWKAVSGMLLTAALGVAFQYMLESEEGTDLDDDGVPDE